ncbi:restriction endonuclease subunit S [Geitlerinema sp. CS-897]|nr:restriction endonuclease subunit S [Geitlerinema sp. CS-897]
MGRYPKYPEYKDSGVEWLGEIPKHWEAKQVKRITRYHKQGYYTNQDYLDEGIKLARITDIDDSGKVSFENMPFVELTDSEVEAFRLKDGDFLFARSGTIGRFGLVRNPEKSIFASYLILFRFREADPEFLRFYFSCLYFKESLKKTLHGGANKNVHAENIKEQILICPPEREQRSLAQFLDYKTAQIDALIAKKEELLERLAEKRTALISEAVTKGIDRTVPMKDSGIEWLGEIPAHWSIIRLKHLCSLLRDGTHLPPPRVSDGIPLLSVRNIVNGEFINLEDDSLISEESFEELNKSFCVQKGDLLLAIVGATLGKVALVKEMPPFAIQRSLAVLRMKPEKMYAKFMIYFIRSSRFQKLLWSNIGYSAQPGIYLGTLGNFHSILPSLDEQIEIVNYINQAVRQLDDFKKKVEIAIETLKEYRTALITNAVTGKIDVRQVEIPDSYTQG